MARGKPMYGDLLHVAVTKRFWLCQIRVEVTDETEMPFLQKREHHWP